MKIVSTNVYVGPNIWASFPVIRHVIELGVLEDWPRSSLARGSSMGWSPPCRGWRSMAVPIGPKVASAPPAGGSRAPGMGHILEHCCLEIQGGAGAEVSFGRARGPPGCLTQTADVTSQRHVGLGGQGGDPGR